jgi:chemotaxis protein CheD
MSIVIVGIGEYAISDKHHETLKTYALGSCVACIAYDKIKKIAGLIHVALPDSEIIKEKSLILPGYFADTGISIFLKKMSEKGAEIKNISVKLVGGANVLNTDNNFDIGNRNAAAIKKILRGYHLTVEAEDIGGSIARTCGIKVEDGLVIVSSSNKNWEL